MGTFLVILGTGNGLLYSSLVWATQANSKNGGEATATAMYAFMRSFGQALGVGIGEVVFQNVMRINLRQLDLPKDIASNAEAFVDILR